MKCGSVAKSDKAIIILRMLCSGNVVGPLFASILIGVIINGVNSKPPSRIYGGRLATKNEFGAAVTLSWPNSFVHSCGGAIIGPRHVLTAGHCVDKRTTDDIVVRAGIDDIRDMDNVVERTCSKVIRHPNYISYIAGKRAVQNDLVILVLKEDLPIGGTIQTLKLPTHPPKVGEDYVVAGWGRNDPDPIDYQFELKTHTMTMGSREICSHVPRTVCAYSFSGTACPGDSGSPLMRNGYVYGIASTSRCIMGDPVDFVDIYDYLDWINAMIEKNP